MEKYEKKKSEIEKEKGFENGNDGMEKEKREKKIDARMKRFKKEWNQLN